jgi:hypothetical protein
VCDGGCSEKVWIGALMALVSGGRREESKRESAFRQASFLLTFLTRQKSKALFLRKEKLIMFQKTFF